MPAKALPRRQLSRSTATSKNNDVLRQVLADAIRRAGSRSVKRWLARMLKDAEAANVD